MNETTLYIMVIVEFLVVIALLVVLLRKNRGESRLSVLTKLAFGFVVLGLLFGETPWLGYGLMGIGIILAVIDIIRKRKAG